MTPHEVARRALVEAVGADGAGALRRLPADPGSPFIALSPDAVVYVAVDDATRRRLEVEARRLRWAADHGVPVPPVLHVGPDVLVTRRVPDDGALTGRAVEAVVAAVDRIASAPPPPAATEDDGGVRAARPVRARLVSAARFARVGVLPTTFVSARAAAAGLTATVSLHGDLQPANVLVAGDGSIHLVDLELAGRGPAGWDLANLWPMLADADDRELVERALDDRTPSRAHRDILLRWLALRFLGDLLGTDDPRLPHALARWREARERFA